MKLIYCPFKNIIYFLLLFIILGQDSYGQSYGLGFSGYEVVQDKRTSLDLSPGKTLCFTGNFQISFDMSFLPNYETYFGYVLRIIENDKRNIDLVYAISGKNRFNMIVGEKLSRISFDIDSSKLFSQWNKIQIKFDIDNDRIIFQKGRDIFIEKGLHLKKNACYKIQFGINNYNQFKSTDAPPMKVRDIRISENGKLRYNWPLNEETGDIAHEIIARNDGAVANPKWITAMHSDWQLEKKITVDGTASVTYNVKDGTVYIVSADSLYSYSAVSTKWYNSAYKNGKAILNVGNQSVYNLYDNNLYNFLPDQKFLNKYNFTTSTWDKKFTLAPLTSYWHINKFISGLDTSLYLFGGYGHLVYKNEVQQYDFNSHIWQQVKVNGDFFTPRYLSALGATQKGDTAYILGGYGSSSGQQILNPKNMYDMMRFTIKDKKFKKLFDLKVKDEDYAFANSLIIDEDAKTYYGLAFPQHKYNSTLQLIFGSLTNPHYKLIGGTVPYAFNDIHSFADLYYNAASKKFIAVTLLRTDNNQTVVNIYTLLSPPHDAINQGTVIQDKSFWSYIVAIVIAGVILVVIYLKLIKKRLATNGQLPGGEIAPVTLQPMADYGEHNLNRPAFNNNSHHKNALLLFGDLQVFDAEGAEITKHFTPLIKELFLMVLLYSIRWGRGLSSEKLNEILWYDKSAKSARNNRSVNIAKLKNLLDKMSDCHLSKETGYWKIDIDYNKIYVDYYNYLSIVKDKKKLDIQKIKNLSEITQRGNFLSNIEYEWLDTFKSEISNEVIDTYLHFAQSTETSHDPELLIEIASYIFYFDPVNEEAMIMKCKALAALGKHSLAKNTFENFIKEYKTIYGEDFKKDFHSVLE